MGRELAGLRGEGGSSPRELILVGAGHAHVQVLHSLAMQPPPRTRVTLVVDTPLAVYSGMVPGLVAGRYRPDQLEIDALPLARQAGARVVLARGLGVEPAAGRIRVDGRPSLPYDVASIDVGSTVAGLDLPGVREHALPTRPIGRFVERVNEVEQAALRGSGPFRIVVAGGGAGGIELAAGFRARLARISGRTVEVTLVHDRDRLLPNSPEGLVRRVGAALDRRGIRRLLGRRVVAVEPGRLVLGDGSGLPFDVLVWSTGAAGPPFFQPASGAPASGGGTLPLDGRGFVLVRPTLQVVGHDEIFAAGDCATLADHPWVPKAGVYAVRQGPLLTRNLRALLAGEPLARYRPQRDFLALLNLGDGSAIGAKWGLSAEGRWVMALKDRIDRRFMRRFQLLETNGAPGPAREGLPAMEGDGEAMVCGGCAAKLGQEELGRALGRLPAAPAAPEVLLGLAEADDVAAYRLPGGDLLAASVDFFRAFTDDPYLVGEVAARNAISDLEAKGVAPRWAQALVALPIAAGAREAEETLFQVLAGARSVFDPLQVRLVGGHTSRASELQVGFSVQGVAEPGSGLLRREAPLAPGMALVLTRPLGTGVIFHADMAGRARGPWFGAALDSIRRSQREGAGIARELGAVAATDVTGFGLAGHLATLLAGSGLSARLHLSSLPALPGALELLARGERSTFHDENARLRKALAFAPGLAADPRAELLFDPQTAGGLLFALPAESAAVAIQRLRDGGQQAARLGEVMAARADGALAEVVAE